MECLVERLCACVRVFVLIMSSVEILCVSRWNEWNEGNESSSFDNVSTSYCVHGVRTAYAFVCPFRSLIWCDENDDRMPSQMGDTYLTNKTIQLKTWYFSFFSAALNANTYA